MEFYIENPKSNLKLPVYVEENKLNIKGISMLKLILVGEGNGIAEVNGDKFAAAAPVLFCLNDRESFKVLEEENMKARMVCFSPAMVNTAFDIENIYGKLEGFPETTRLDHFYFIPFIKRSGDFRGKMDLGPNSYKKLSSLIDALKQQNINYSDGFWPCRNRSFIIELLLSVSHIYAENLSGVLELSSSGSNIQDILLYLQLNYNTKIRIQDITSRFHTNRNTLSKRFKEETGLSVMDYMLRLRIKIACILLRDTNLPITEVMERAGFTDASYWGRAFKRFIGKTPTDYRRG